MKTVEIKGSIRTELGKKSSKQLRKTGLVPCVIYGKEKNIHFFAHENSFKNLVYTHEAHLVKLIIDGVEIVHETQDIVGLSGAEVNDQNLMVTKEDNTKSTGVKEYSAVLKDMQFHPVKDNILHADFIEVFDDKPVVINIPINVTGDSAGVIAGGKLMIKRRSLKVKGFAIDLPEYLTVDITNLQIHESTKVGDLSYGKLELLDPKKSMVLTIATSRVAQKTDAEIAAEAAAETAAATPAAPAAPAAE